MAQATKSVVVLDRPAAPARYAVASTRLRPVGGPSPAAVPQETELRAAPRPDKPAWQGLAWPFTGRDTELALLHQQVRAGTVTFVTGGRGIGKTSLLREFLLRAEQDLWSVVRLSAREAPGRLLGTLGAYLPPGGEPAAAGELRRATSLDLVRSGAARRLLIAVDDAERLDAAAAEVLNSLAVDHSTALLLVLAADEAPPEPLVHLISEQLVGWLRLAPLGPDEVAEVVRVALGRPCDQATCRSLHEASEGNLTVLRELVCRGLDEGRLALDYGLYRWRGALALTGPLGAVIDARLAALPAQTREQLELVAVAQRLDLQAAYRLIGAAGLAELERRGLVRLRQEGSRHLVTPGHAALTERARAVLSPLQIRSHFLRLAEIAVESPSRRRSDDVCTVGWLLDAGAPVETARLLAAARAAWSQRQYGEVLRFAAAAQTAGADVSALVLQGQALHALGRVQDAELCLRRSLASVLTPSQHRHVCRLRARNACLGLGRPDIAVTLLGEAAASQPGAAEQLELDCLQATALFWRGAPAAALERVHALLAAAGRDPSRCLTCLPINVLAAAQLGQLHTALDEADRLVPVIHTHRWPAPWLATEVEFGRWQALLWLDRLDEAEQLAVRHWSACSAPDELPRQRVWSIARGLTALRRGLAGQASVWLREAMGQDRITPLPWLSLGLAGLAEACALLGDQAGTEQALGDCRAVNPPTGNGRPAMAVRVAEAWLAVSQGELAIARSRFQEMARAAHAEQLQMTEMEALDALVRLGQGRQVSRQVLAAAGSVEGDAAVLRGRRATALMAGDGGALSEIAARFAAAGLMLTAAESSCQAAEVYRRQGLPDAAQREMARAEGWASRCEGLATLPLLGFSRSATSLTPRQREIAQLASTGASSPAIARQLVLSVRTVESHLYNCFAKLGVSTREELAGVLSGGALR